MFLTIFEIVIDLFAIAITAVTAYRGSRATLNSATPRARVARDFENPSFRMGLYVVAASCAYYFSERVDATKQMLFVLLVGLLMGYFASLGNPKKSPETETDLED